MLPAASSVGLGSAYLFCVLSHGFSRKRETARSLTPTLLAARGIAAPTSRSQSRLLVLRSFQGFSKKRETARSLAHGQLYFFCHPLSRCVTDLFINIAFFCVGDCHNLIILCAVYTLGLLTYYENYELASKEARKNILKTYNITSKLTRVEYNEEHYMVRFRSITCMAHWLTRESE